ncbi:MAG: biopolymer transporter ExbD [Desulfobacteraceae bacterium]|nr:MAG: biopolymer transporter ExbD [Desulfobacteraceae bacterium]
MIATAIRKQRKKVEIPLTPLIDIVFLLLIYFLLTTNFLVEEAIHIKLPQAKASAPQMNEELTVSVDRSGKVFLKGREISIDLLYTALKEMIDPEADQLVVVKADREVILNAAVKVMDVANAAGAARLSLATERDF